MTQTRGKKKPPIPSTQKKEPSSSKSKDTILLCWCDGGSTDGKFTQGVVYSLLTSKLPIKSAMRIQGNQIGRQRQNGFDYWHKSTDFDWILWIDSDIHVTNEVLRKLWEVADAEKRPIVCGTYFISKENEQTLMAPYPALFNWTDNEYELAYVHPLPANTLIQVAAAGFGMVLMHRSVAEKMRKELGDIPFFNETGVGEQFVSEDINFFRHMAKVGIPLFAHTGALVEHIKRFTLDINYYKLFWNSRETNPRIKA